MKRVSKEEYEKMTAAQKLVYARQMQGTPKQTHTDRFAKSRNGTAQKGRK